MFTANRLEIVRHCGNTKFVRVSPTAEVVFAGTEEGSVVVAEEGVDEVVDDNVLAAEDVGGTTVDEGPELVGSADDETLAVE